MEQTKDTILIVDDSPSNREELKSVLEHDYITIEADSGAEAISYLNNAAFNPQLILAAFDMSAINGLELLQALRESPLYSEIPLILLLDKPDPDMIDAAISSDADDIILRPVNPALLKKRVQNTIKLHPVVYYKNIMEKLVTDEVENCINNLGICTCSVCRNDLICLTLNHLPPKYVNTDKGEAFSKVEKLSANFRAKILTSIAEASEIVKEHPRHRQHH